MISRLFLVHRRTFYQAGKIDAVQFEQRWSKFFRDECEDLFELQRGLNNCFAYDIVPQATVLEQALYAARRLDSFATAARIFWALRSKVETDAQYSQYLQYLEPAMSELGVLTSFDLGRLESM